MNKNDLLTGFVDSYGSEGEGVLHAEGVSVFVPYTIKGEKITCKILKVKGNIAFGKVEEILIKSDERTEPRCPVFSKCGGCNLQHVEYANQLEIKREIVKNCFKKIAHIDAEVESVFPSEPYGYRNKLQLPVRCVNKKVVLGFFRSNSHDVVPTDECAIQADGAKKIIGFFKKFLSENDLPAYDESTKKGILKHIVVRGYEGEFLFTLVTKSGKINCVNRLIEGLIAEFGEKISVVRNFNDADTNVILGEKCEVLYGSGFIGVCEENVRYEIGPYSFMQVNNAVKRKIYEDVVSLGNVDKNTVVIDGYSGAGVMTSMLAKRAKKAYGIEIVREASLAAEKLKKDNGISNMFPVCAPCEEALPEILAEEKAKGGETLLVLDPPRKGADSSVIAAILSSLPERIIYVSCSPSTLARDAGLLIGSLKQENGKIVNGNVESGAYKIETIRLYDMFAQTSNVETLVVFSKKLIKIR